MVQRHHDCQIAFGRSLSIVPTEGDSGQWSFDALMPFVSQLVSLPVGLPA
jgi:hypothetical protein